MDKEVYYNGEDICKINRSCSGVVTIESYIE